MTILTLTQFKGGCGKSTSAICIATLLSQSQPTLLIDSDPNRSASLWARKGKLPFTVCTDTEAPKLISKGKFEHIVIDTPARPNPDELASLANGCDLLILPTTPDPLSLSALAQIAGILPDGCNYRVLITIVPPPPQPDGKDALESLRKASYPVFDRVIRRYKAYIKASDSGLPVSQVQGGGIAWHDWQALWGELKDAIQ